MSGNRSQLAVFDSGACTFGSSFPFVFVVGLAQARVFPSRVSSYSRVAVYYFGSITVLDVIIASYTTCLSAG